MQEHTKVYRTFYNLKDISEFFCVECGTQADDIHHLDAKKLGGSKLKNHIENLAAVCRKHHELCHKDSKFNAKIKCTVLDMVKEVIKARGKF